MNEENIKKKSPAEKAAIYYHNLFYAAFYLVTEKRKNENTYTEDIRLFSEQVIEETKGILSNLMRHNTITDTEVKTILRDVYKIH